MSVAELGATAFAAVIVKSGPDCARVDSGVIGEAIQAGSGISVADQGSINAAIPVTVPAMTVECGCGLGT